MVGANLLTWSNTYNVSPWSTNDVTLTSGQTDPTGGTNAWEAVFSLDNSTQAYISQTVKPNYSPVASNTFTFSVWMKVNSVSGTPTIYLEMIDSTANVMVNTQITPTTSWALYQVTGVAAAGASSVTVYITDPSSTSTEYFIYGAQLEIGGPATPTSITQNKPAGVYLWGIQAPTTALTFTLTTQTGSTGLPWQPNTDYSQTTFTITGVASTSGTTAVYVCSGNPGGSSSWAGRYFKVTGFTGVSDTANNSSAPGFICSAVGLSGSNRTLTLSNASAYIDSGQSATGTLLDTIVDSNGNLEVAYTPGKSGGSAPVWNPVQGGATQDGLQNVISQTNEYQSATASGSLAFSNNVTPGDTIFVFLAFEGTSTSPSVSDGQLDSFTKAKGYNARNLGMYVFYCSSATGGATTVSFTGCGTPTWMGIAEVANMTGVDGTPGSNVVADSSSALFLTGSTTISNIPDMLVTFAMFLNVQSGLEIGSPPYGYQNITGQQQTSTGNGTYWNMAAAFEFPSATGTYNPTWTVTNPNAGFNDAIGVTVAFESSVGTLVWYNLGQTSTSGLSPKIGYQYYYSFVNTTTGHRSNVSPISASTGAQTGVAITVTGRGCQISNSGTGAATGNGDPQVDAIEVYRNTDGGGFWYQIPPSLMQSRSGTITDANGTLYLANPGSTTSVGSWSFVDTVPDTSLNTQIYAPIGYLNSTPEAGLTNLEFFDNRLWGSVGNFLYYATSTDDASLLNVLENGVSPESWEPTNYIPFNSPIVRSVATGVGIVVFTTTDVWVVSGTNLATYTTTKVLTGIGLGTYNGVCIDGSTMMLYTRDRECLMFNVNAGAAEIGFLIGDLIETDMNPMTCYLARHVKGSQDNAFYFGTGPGGFDSDSSDTGWFRLNPNQYGASASGEQTPIWSPAAHIASAAGGCGALASVEVQPGVKLLLVGRTGTGTGPILNRNISVFADNGTEYSWSATVGSIMLALPGKLAEIESVTTEMTAATATQCTVAVLIDEIDDSVIPFETLAYSTPDPPQLTASKSVLSNRFYLSFGTVPPVGRHMQIKLSGAAASTKDEILALTVRGALIEEQD
jgi:hypothetical protein